MDPTNETHRSGPEERVFVSPGQTRDAEPVPEQPADEEHIDERSDVLPPNVTSEGT